MKLVSKAFFLIIIFAGSVSLSAQSVDTPPDDVENTESVDTPPSDVEKTESAPDDKVNDAPTPVEPEPPAAADDDNKKSVPKKKKPAAEGVFNADDAYATSPYMRGDMDVHLGIGPFIPLFAYAFNFTNASSIQLNVGPVVSLGLDFYWTPHVKFGLNVELASAKGVNGNAAYFVPITASAAYEFHFYSLSVPVGGEVGVLVSTYRGMTALSPIIKPKVGVMWNFNSKWAVGVSAAYWFIPQPVWSELSKSRVGNAMEVAICGQYHF